MQQIQIIGRLGADCEVVDYNGRKFSSFSVAVDDNYTDGEGTKVNRTNWYKCTMDNTKVSQYLTKGTQVFIQGKPRSEVYQSKKDNKWYSNISVSVNKLELLGSPTDKNNQNDLPPVTNTLAPIVATQPTAKALGGEISSEGDNDLPF